MGAGEQLANLWYAQPARKQDIRTILGTPAIQSQIIAISRNDETYRSGLVPQRTRRAQYRVHLDATAGDGADEDHIEPFVAIYTVPVPEFPGIDHVRGVAGFHIRQRIGLGERG